MRFAVSTLPLLLLALGPIACPPSPPPPKPLPPVVFDGGAITPTCATLCQNLAALQCPEGLAADCLEACVKLSSAGDAHVTCGTTAHDQNAARVCGFRCNTGPAQH